MPHDGVPDPAARRAHAPEPAARERLTTLPWESALFEAVRAVEARLDECRQENAQLVADNAQLQARLYKAQVWARQQTENWRLRQAAWNRERAELLARLGGRP